MRIEVEVVVAGAGPIAIAVELLEVHINAPALAVDDDADEVGLRRGEVVPGDVVVEDGAQEGGVTVRVKEVEGAVAAEVLVLVGEDLGGSEAGARPWDGSVAPGDGGPTGGSV